MKLARFFILAITLSTLAQAQGLVGAPVDPRYGQSNETSPSGYTDSWFARLVRAVRSSLGL